MNCSSKGFKALMLTQFLGALNDNLFKLLLSLLTVNQLAKNGGDVTHLVLLNAVFVLPFILLSPLAGSLADKYPKNQIAVATKYLEVFIMALGCLFLWQSNLVGLFVVLFFLGVQAALFSPAKYGILPEILSVGELSRGNGAIECWTFVAIIIGTAAGGLLSALANGNLLLPGLVALALSFVGLFSSHFITKTHPARKDALITISPAHVIGTLRSISKDRRLRLIVLGVCYFWFAASMFQLDILIYSKTLAGLNDLQASILITSLALGVGLGSWFAGVISAGKVELGLVPIGGIGLSLFSVCLTFSVASFYITLGILFFLGCSAGIFIVPLNSFYQEFTPEAERGSYIAASNVVVFVGVLLTSPILFFLINGIGLSANGVILFVAATAILVTSYLCWLLPEVLVRCINWLLIHTIYRLSVFGAENIPTKGGALLVCNHVSYADASLVLAAIGRPVRFMIYEPIYNNPLVHPFAKACQAIPVSASASPKAILRSLLLAREAIRNGELVAIFAEGSLTRLGRMLPFSRGLEQIMKGCAEPIIPLYLDQMWGSIFSFSEKKFFWKFPRHLPYPVTISFGVAMPSASSSFKVREAIQMLSTEAFSRRQAGRQLLHLEFLHVVKKNLFRTAVYDENGQAKSFLKLAAAARMLSLVLDSVTKGTRAVGIVLPPSYGAVVSNLALLFANKLPVNLNYTASVVAFSSAISQSGIEIIITSRVFWEKTKLISDRKIIFLEDLLAKFTGFRKIVAVTQIIVAPARVLQKLFVPGIPEAEDPATIIFSSGSSGEPKGVLLSHRNIMANLTALSEVFNLRNDDCMLGVLPFFHSFGFTGTLWLTLLAPVRAAFHPNPLDASAIGELVQEFRVTLLLSTPTFLQTYLRKISPDQFRTLRIVVVGAEKLNERTAKAFHETFGIFPMEGYGCTELSPVAAINVPNYVSDGHEQIGFKFGTVGHPLPGIALRIVDPESYQEMSEEQEGLLLVKGANVMLGYLDDPVRTADVVRDGWYETGDIAKVDSEGFLTITDRLSRFSKIGGEMVPHGTVEAAIEKIIGGNERKCVVSSVPDESRGERLVVFLTIDFDSVFLREEMKKAGLPNLWIPKASDFYRIEEFPMLGSGKINFRELRLKLSAA